MRLPRSAYYRQPKNNVVDDSELIALIEAIIEEFPGYGYRFFWRRSRLIIHPLVSSVWAFMVARARNPSNR